MLDSYFAGNTPFTTIKNREDIPDAFIFQSISRILTSEPNLIVVSNDRNLRLAAEKAGAVPFDSITAILKSDSLQALLKSEELDRVVMILALLEQFLPKHIDSIEEELDSASQGYELEYTSFSTDSDASIDSMALSGDIEYEFDEAKYIGNGTFYIPFETTGEALVDFTIERYEWFSESEGKGRNISISPLNDHYYAAQEYAEGTVLGSVFIRLPLDDNSSSTVSEKFARELLDQLEVDSVIIDSVSFKP